MPHRVRLVASADFAVDKPAGHPCRHLHEGGRCGIHAELRDHGFPGCTVFDCSVAGQHVTPGHLPHQTQLEAARGDAATAIPPVLDRPVHWAAGAPFSPGRQPRPSARAAPPSPAAPAGRRCAGWS